LGIVATGGLRRLRLGWWSSLASPAVELKLCAAFLFLVLSITTPDMNWSIIQR